MYAVEGEMRRGEDRDRKALIARKRDTDGEEEDSRHHHHSWLSARTSLIPSRTPIQSDKHNQLAGRSSRDHLTLLNTIAVSCPGFPGHV